MHLYAQEVHKKCTCMQCMHVYARVFCWAQTTRDSGTNYTCPGPAAAKDVLKDLVAPANPLTLRS